MSTAAAAALGALLLASAPRAAQGFYLPGVAPTNFIEGQRVELKVCARGLGLGRFGGMDGLDVDGSVEEQSVRLDVTDGSTHPFTHPTPNPHR